MQKIKHNITNNYIKMLIQVFIIIFFTNTFLIQIFYIPSSSMENHMLAGDNLFVDKVCFSKPFFWFDSLILPQKNIQRFDIVAFKAPHEIKNRNLNQLWYVKRIIGLPGEIIQIKNKSIYINGEKIIDPFANLNQRLNYFVNFPIPSDSIFYTKFPDQFKTNIKYTAYGSGFIIPDKNYFCMGDNRDLSSDSRVWGPVPRDNITGKPWRVLWSVKVKPESSNKKNFFEKVKSLILLIPEFLMDTRWNRFFKKYE